MELKFWRNIIWSHKIPPYTHNKKPGLLLVECTFLQHLQELQKRRLWLAAGQRQAESTKAVVWLCLRDISQLCHCARSPLEITTEVRSSRLEGLGFAKAYDEKVYSFWERRQAWTLGLVRREAGGLAAELQGRSTPN